MPAERRTIDELVTLYELEPDLRDIYVEGPSDKAILEGLLEEIGISGVSVSDISSVDIPADPGNEDDEDGNRDRVVKLAKALGEALENSDVRLACIVDSDFDHLTASDGSAAFLLKTDYANMEMYFFSAHVMEKLNRRCFRNRRITESMRQAFMVPTLQLLFRIRYANFELGWKLKKLPFDGFVSLKGDAFDFDGERYVREYVTKNGRYPDRSAFSQKVSGVAFPSELDPRCFIHGHDFTILLRKMLQTLGEKKLSKDIGVLISALHLCADYAAMAQEPLFAKVCQRFQ